MKKYSYLFFLLFVCSCEGHNARFSTESKKDEIALKETKKGSLPVGKGDAYEIINSNNQFGLIVTDVNSQSNYGIDISFALIKLDLNKRGIDKFKSGKIDISYVPSSTGFVKGYFAIYMSKECYLKAKDQLKKVGKLNILEEFDNINGGSLVQSVNEVEVVAKTNSLSPVNPMNPEVKEIGVSQVFN